MCGIMGYVGKNAASDLLLGGLRRLEYRGYDSAGIATLDGGQMQLRRAVGRVDRLARFLTEEPAAGTIGIAHTRWATHGRPTVKNAHPHLDASGKIVIVHNGVIENHSTIRVFLEQQGIEFGSDTDTEALAQLIGFFYGETDDLLGSIRRALCEVRGTFGLAIMCTDMPHTLFAARRGSPLIVGVGADEYLISSDASAIVPHTTQVTYLNDNELMWMGPEGVQATTIDAVPVEKSFDTLEFTLDAIELGGFEHHMLKEIYEQPESLRNTMRGRVNQRCEELSLGGISKCEREISRCQRVLLFGCGSACHAGLIGEYLFEELAGIPTDVDCASELRYRNPIIEESTLGIAISQSGETADTVAALREVRMKGALVLGVVNSVGSTIARETDAGIYLHAGPEIG
ncbi:MAG TPA: glutamine--fructose-6-phosphate transaminase (isomerizing), partial [Planctomycetaceae bacterium]